MLKRETTPEEEEQKNFLEEEKRHTHTKKESCVLCRIIIIY